MVVLMMHLMVLYDVSSDRIRTKIATACEDYGLDRVQYSAFYGRLSRPAARPAGARAACADFR